MNDYTKCCICGKLIDPYNDTFRYKNKDFCFDCHQDELELDEA